MMPTWMARPQVVEKVGDVERGAYEPGPKPLALRPPVRAPFPGRLGAGDGTASVPGFFRPPALDRTSAGLVQSFDSSMPSSSRSRAVRRCAPASFILKSTARSSPKSPPPRGFLALDPQTLRRLSSEMTETGRADSLRRRCGRTSSRDGFLSTFLPKKEVPLS